MLKTLKIKNFALIQDEKINFAQGLNIIMGETGAGKSMLISALEILLGGRAVTDMVRRGEKKSILEAEFDFPAEHTVYDYLRKNDLDDDNNIIIRREFAAKGGSRSFLNDTPVQVNELKALSDLIIDFHGQHEHQSLLYSENHIKYIDLFSANEVLQNIYKKSFQKLTNEISEYKQLLAKKKQLKERIDFDKFRLNEILEVEPKLNEDTELEAELKILQNAENIILLSKETNSLLYYSENAAYNLLNTSIENLKQLVEYNPDFASYGKELKTSLISIKEIAETVKDYANEIEYNPAKIDEIRKRLAKLKTLQKKYGSIENIITLKEKLQNDVNLVENFDFEIQQITLKIEKLKLDTGEAAKYLSKNRRKFAKEFAHNIEGKLFQLSIENAKFNVKFNLIEEDTQIDSVSVKINDKYYKAYSNGIDELLFYISTNLGEELKPLQSVASGGEISRIMLAIKSLIAKSSALPVLVFDEIDVGISGRVAQKTGIEMKKISKDHQIISITHLPQIAALGDRIILVEKFEENDTTLSKAKILNQDGKIIEIAKLLSDGKTSDTARKTAEQLIDF